MLPVATSLFVVFCLLATVLGTTQHILADNIVDFGSDFREIAILKETKPIKTKQYKKRKNYSEPISSEISDYEDSIIIEQIEEKKEPKIRETQVRETKIQKLAKTQLPKIPPAVKQPTFDKPKIVIIIDDIATKKQLDDITRIGMNLTPSIFPISPRDTAMIEAVDKLDFFMIHLPLEAKRYSDEMKTLKINESEENIELAIKNITQIAPKTRYINNHTGSRFTESKSDMKRLLGVLENFNIKFVDSRTTPNSALHEIALEKNELFLWRDIFIDNNLDRESLNAQLMNGVNLAKNRGYAILIAHPHKETLQAIKAARDNILSEVDIIYLNELDNILKNANITAYSQKINK